jgi:peroxiredoxin
MTAPTINPITIGDEAPDFVLPATDEKTYSLQSFAASPLVIIFLANHCPYVAAWEDRIVGIGREYGRKGVRFAAISSNDAEKFPQDSFEEMEKRAKQHSYPYPFPYLYDESQSVARDFGATRTPEVFLFDAGGTLVYHGAVDSDFEDGPDTEPYLRRALDQLLAGGKISQPSTQPLGCSMKWKNAG